MSKSKKQRRMAAKAARAPAFRSSGWAVVRTQALREKTAAANVKALGFTTFLPLALQYIVDRTSRHRRMHKIAVLRPIFPQYMMVLIDALKDPWQGINSAIGVHGMLCAGDQPVFMPDGLVEALQEQGFEKKGLPKRKPEVGMQVDVVDGPWSSFMGKIARIDARDRITVLLAVFGRQTQVQLEAGQFVIREK